MPDTWWGEGKAAAARDYRDRAAQPRLVAGERAEAHPEDEGVGEQDALEAGDHRLRLQPPRRGRHGRHGATAGPRRDWDWGGAGQGGASGTRPEPAPCRRSPRAHGNGRVRQKPRCSSLLLLQGAPGTPLFCEAPCPLSPPILCPPAPVFCYPLSCGTLSPLASSLRGQSLVPCRLLPVPCHDLSGVICCLACAIPYLFLLPSVSCHSLLSSCHSLQCHRLPLSPPTCPMPLLPAWCNPLPLPSWPMPPCGTPCPTHAIIPCLPGATPYLSHATFWTVPAGLCSPAPLPHVLSRRPAGQPPRAGAHGTTTTPSSAGLPEVSAG